MASFPFLEHVRLFPTMEPLHTLATVWNALLMTNIFLFLRPQPECHLCREAFHSHIFPERLPPKIILSYPVLPLIAFLPFAMLYVFDFLFICLAPSLGYETHRCRNQTVLFTKVYSVPWHSLAREKCKINLCCLNEGINEKVYGRTTLDLGSALTASAGLPHFALFEALTS